MITNVGQNIVENIVNIPEENKELLSVFSIKPKLNDLFFFIGEMHRENNVLNLRSFQEYILLTKNSCMIESLHLDNGVELERKINSVKNEFVFSFKRKVLTNVSKLKINYLN